MTSLHDIGLTRTLLLRIVVSNATAFHCNYCCLVTPNKPQIKGGESSSQFQWFTIATIEL